MFWIGMNKLIACHFCIKFWARDILHKESFEVQTVTEHCPLPSVQVLVKKEHECVLEVTDSKNV